jgi:hypothetical protein
VLHPELSAVLGSDRFLHEIQLTASLQHPHILPLCMAPEQAAGERRCRRGLRILLAPTASAVVLPPRSGGSGKGWGHLAPRSLGTRHYLAA